MSTATINDLTLKAVLVGTEIIEISEENGTGSFKTPLTGLSTVFQLLSEKDAVNGYAGLDASGLLKLAQFPTGTALQVLRRNAGNTALEFATLSDLQGITSINGDTTAAQIIAGTANRISLVDAGDTHTLDIDVAYVGQASITTLGTITTGVWNGTAITGANINAAFTDLNDIPVAGGGTMVLQRNAGDTAYEWIATPTSSFIGFTADANLDMGEFDIINTGLLNQKIDNTTAIHELEANHTTPADAQIIGQIDFIDDDSVGTRRTYAQIRSVIHSPTTTNEVGELIFSAIENGTLADFITLNETSGNDVTFHKSLNMTGGSISNVGTLSVQSQLNLGSSNSIIWAGNANRRIQNLTTGFEFEVEIDDSYLFQFNNTTGFELDGVGSLTNVVCGNQAVLATNATDGFLYIPGGAGAPTGTPTAYTGKVAMYYDTTNEALYIYNGAWVSVTLA